jgi:hypothetical protein
MLDAHDQPFVAYRAAFNLPMLARFDIPSGKWTTEAIPGSAIVFSVDRALAIARDRQDRPTVAYYDQSRNIQLATRTPGGWTLRTHSLQQSSPASTGVALDFDSENAAHVATRISSRLSILRFGTLGVSTIYTSDSITPVQINPHSMRMDSNNGISIAHLDQAQGTIAVATRGAIWSTTVVDKPFFATAPSLALDPSQRWVIAYTDSLKGQLKVSARAWWDFARPDFDDDGHVDGQDVQHFAACVTGPGVTQSELSCFDTDLDSDGDVDQADFGVLQACYSGPVDAANPQCAD